MNMAKKVFSLARRRVLRAIFTPRAIFDGLSSIKTTSAASIAASDPSPPIAIPRSALASTGASLMPSPTKASVFPDGLLSRSFSNSETLSAGKSSAWNSSSPMAEATYSPTSRLSPVSITVFVTPSALRALIASAESALILSETTMCPTYVPSTLTCTIVPFFSQGFHFAPTASIILVLPTQTVFPFTTARTP